MYSGAFYVAKIAAFSRLLVLILQVIFNWLPDHKADAFQSDSRVPDETLSFLDVVIRNSLDGFHKWDAKYILHVARYGYEEERMLAFFPLFPFLLKTLCIPFYMLSDSPSLGISPTSSLLISGMILNTLFFVGASIALYRLTCKVYRNEKFASLCAVMFCFNPASIFFSANYTEALYAFCMFHGLYYLKERLHIKSTLFFMGASATRSNGVVNAGFIAYFAAREIIQISQKDSTRKNIPTLLEIFFLIIRTASHVFATFIPFALVNLFGYRKFCASTVWSTELETLIVNDIPQWCNASLPVVYSHIQSKYWDVGFLKYYQIQKIPNILLAMPCTVLIFLGTRHYLRRNLDQIKTLGLVGSTEKHTMTRPKMHVLEFAKCNIFVYLVHALFLLLFGLCFMHVEVVTRFLFSSSPLSIWIAASLVFRDLSQKDVDITNLGFLSGDLHKFWAALSQTSKIVVIYFVSYIIVGTFMHVNFLPWT